MRCHSTTWHDAAGTELRIAYEMSLGEPYVLSIIDAEGREVELTDMERADLAIDLETGHHGAAA